ncbi:MAG TPA: hypothetical protein VGK81_01090, partial [Anaerolineae bacterium]
GRQALAVVHSFGAEAPIAADIPLPGEGWRLKESLAAPGYSPFTAGAALRIPFECEYDASVAYLVKA